jgi:septum formation protein
MNDTTTVILASQSPRRHELLTLAGIPHKIFVSGADEGSVDYVPGHPEEFVTAAAELKNAAVRKALAGLSDADLPKFDLTRAEAGNAVILSADTIVYSDVSRTIFGKPGSERGAFEMLRELSGRAHRVITGVMLYDTATGRTARFAESTDVYFRPLDDREIETYIRVHHPLDKAGAYGIQDGACVFVEKLAGDYYNVVGLPVCRVYTELNRLRG